MSEIVYVPSSMRDAKIEITKAEGYDFYDEYGNLVCTTKIVLEKKKPKYPQNYEECCKVLNYCCNPSSVKTTHREELIRKFQFLLLARDAYWKIAGEEMGLGKLWKPTKGDSVFSISRMRGKIGSACHLGECCIFEFPTKEMRDAFKENFDEKLEFCKELL